MSKIDDLMRQGLQLHQAGRIAEAEGFYARVLDKQPSHAAANHLAGLALLQRGDAAGAVVRLQRAVHVRGDDPEYLGNLGTALNAAGRPAEAVEVFDRALRLQRNAPAILNNRAMALKALNQLDDAIDSYRAAIALLPNEPGFHRNLGNALAGLGDWHGAEAAYRRALALRPNFPNAVTGLGSALEALNRKDEAIAATAAIAARFPAESEIHRALGHAHWVSGHPEQAASAYRAAIAAAPRDAEAHRMLGLIVPRSARDAEVQAVESLLADPAVTGDQRAQLEFTLGQAFDDMGDQDAANAHFGRANEIIRGLRPFDIEKARAQMADLEATFAALPDSEVPSLAKPTGPVFIVGLPRSGKTTLEGKLARHPSFFPAGEFPLLGNMAANLGEDGVRRVRELYLSAAERLAPGKRLLDTMPGNVLHIGLIRKAMPEARILLCTRDPAGHVQALSRKYYAQSGNEYASDPATLQAYLGLYRGLMAFWSRKFPGFILESTDIRTICGFVGISLIEGLDAPYLSEPRLPRR